MVEQGTIRFEQQDNSVFVYGYPELKDRKGILAGDGMAFFFGEGWRNYELYVANTLTGKIRKLSTTDGELLVDDDDIDYDEIKSATHGIVNRAHIAAKLTEKGYTGSIKEAFATLLAKDGKYFVQPRRLDVFETIEFIKSIGAVAVLAHPFLNLSESELREFLPEAIRHGLDGMETLYSTYDLETTALSVSIAREYGLAESGGSDFHGARKPDITLGTGRGDLCVPDTFLKDLRSRI